MPKTGDLGSRGNYLRPWGKRNSPTPVKYLLLMVAGENIPLPSRRDVALVRVADFSSLPPFHVWGPSPDTSQ